MLDQLNEVLGRLPSLLRERDGWSSLIINRRKPYTYRAFRQEGDLRICLHRFEVCEEEESFLHPHPWPGAFCILGGSYLMSLGRSPCRESVPRHVAKVVMVPGSKYEITDPLTWHSVTPLGHECWTVMVNGTPWSPDTAHTQVKTTKGKDLESLTPEQLGDYLHRFGEIYQTVRNTGCLTT